MKKFLIGHIVEITLDIFTKDYCQNSYNCLACQDVKEKDTDKETGVDRDKAAANKGMK